MKTRLFLLVAAFSAVIALTTLDASAQVINPYLPYNAIAADPPTPYNLLGIPKCSRKYYDPCPSVPPAAAQFPDLTPVWQPFPGPFGIPVPVP